MFEFQFEGSKEKYGLDKIKYGSKDDEWFPALTKDNSEFIEAVVKLDSRYGKEGNEYGEPNKQAKDKLQKLAKSSDYPFGKNLTFSLDKEDNDYIGTTHYWFKQIKENKENNFLNILGALYNINLTNSTRRSYKEVFYKAKFLKDKLNNKLDTETIKAELLKDYNTYKYNHILSYLTDPKAMDENGSCTLSLASKFCSYACEYIELDKLNNKYSYSKYDTIVSDHLHLYIDYYLQDIKDIDEEYLQAKKNNFKVKANVKNRYEEYLKTYKAYSFFIDEILKKIYSQGILLNKNELDHIIWYSKK